MAKQTSHACGRFSRARGLWSSDKLCVSNDYSQTNVMQALVSDTLTDPACACDAFLDASSVRVRNCWIVLHVTDDVCLAGGVLVADQYGSLL